MPSQVRSIPAARPPGAPPAIWLAFAKQGAWKNWVMAGQLLVIFFLLAVCVAVARTEPDVVVVTPEGKSTYVPRSAANAALLRFLQEQKSQPSDVTVVHFTEEFLRLTLAVNSSTIDEAWPKALELMAPQMRARLKKESEEQKLLDTYKLAQVRTRLEVEGLVLVERVGDVAQVRATVTRFKSSLAGGAGEGERVDRVEVDLVLRTVPRSQARPDGLEVADWRVKVILSDPSASASGDARAP